MRTMQLYPAACLALPDVHSPADNIHIKWKVVWRSGAERRKTTCMGYIVYEKEIILRAWL